MALLPTSISASEIAEIANSDQVGYGDASAPADGGTKSLSGSDYPLEARLGAEEWCSRTISALNLYSPNAYLEL